MGCGLKKQNNTQSGVHLTERTCSPYNPIIKQIVDDCLGLPVYPITSIDAVIDENGTTLRQLLEDLLKELKDEINSRELVQRIELILETINSLDETYATIEAVEDLENNLGNLKDWLLLVSSLEDIAPNELAEQVHPTIVAAVKQILSILGITPGTEETNLILELADIKALVEEIGKCGNGDLRNPANSVVWIVDYVKNILEGGEFAHLNPLTSQLREDEYPVTSAYFVKNSDDFSTFMSKLLGNLGVNQSVYAYFYKNVPYGISPKSSPVLYDFNNNHVTDFGDVALLILDMLGNADLSINGISADIDNDGEIDMGDVNDLTDYILTHWDDPNFDTYITSSNSAGFIFQFTRRVVSDSLVTNLPANGIAMDIEEIFSDINGLELRKYPLIDGKIYSDLYESKTYRYNANSKTMVLQHLIKSLDPSIIIELDEDNTVVYTVQLPGSSVLFVKELGIITNPITEEEETREVVHVDINPATFFSPDGTVTISGFNENHQIELSVDLSDVVESSSNTISVDSYSNDRIDINVNLDELVKSTNETIDIDTTGDKIDLGVSPALCKTNIAEVNKNDNTILSKKIEILPWLCVHEGVNIVQYSGDPENPTETETPISEFVASLLAQQNNAAKINLRIPKSSLSTFRVGMQWTFYINSINMIVGIQAESEELSKELLEDKRKQLLALYNEISEIESTPENSTTKSAILDMLETIANIDVSGVDPVLIPLNESPEEYVSLYLNMLYTPKYYKEDALSEPTVFGANADDTIEIFVKNDDEDTYHIETLFIGNLAQYAKTLFDYTGNGVFDTADVQLINDDILKHTYITFEDVDPVEITTDPRLEKVKLCLFIGRVNTVTESELVTNLKNGTYVYDLSQRNIYIVTESSAGKVVPYVNLKLSIYVVDGKLVSIITNNDVAISRAECLLTI